MRIIGGEVGPCEYEIGTGIGTSINDLVKKVETITGKKVKRLNQDFLLKEAPSLYSRNPLSINPLKLDVGIKMVMYNLITHSED